MAGALLRLCTRFILLWGRTLADMQFMQVCFGAGVASEVVFNAYVFALVVRGCDTTPRYVESALRLTPHA